MPSTGLQALPNDILIILLPEYLHNIEDLVNLASTCTALRDSMATASPSTILRLAAAQTRTFFRPSPHFLVAATARELGHWARRSEANEAELLVRLEEGLDGLLNLAMARCGLTMERIRKLYLMRFSIINPTTDLIDKCVGKQWYAIPNFWSGGASDACSIESDPSETTFHLAIYGELFGPDFDTILDQDQPSRRLGVETRLDYIRYCVSDPKYGECGHWIIAPLSPEPVDRRHAFRKFGPRTSRGSVFLESERNAPRYDHNTALKWVLRSSRWRPRWKNVRAKAGGEFQNDVKGGGGWHDDYRLGWRQRMLKAVMVCQGLEGLGMLRPGLQDQWTPTIRAWRTRIAGMIEEPKTIKFGEPAIVEYPFLLEDLKTCLRDI
ncbi:hypothetical protein B0A50_08518 [Salinomyces thailandicus]|uniref:Uncharacterized protein n=1 Tax=Salinomyces thailandicus TaxID=706561 RepID=A0A4V5N357_9PEZI|nr:hypothetical protein B0A50_08518 [Salinomyces thailandica]